MAHASIETTLDFWASSLRDVKSRIRPLFTQERVAVSAGLFLDGLLGDERRKTGWMRAEAAGDRGPWRQQSILGRSRWDADALRDVVRAYVMGDLAADDAVLVIDETGFLKQGKGSCGVGRQYTGSAGKITNCQIGVFASYVSRHGHAFIDRALYLPKSWTDDPARMAAAHVPEDTGFATKPRLAATMIDRAIEADVPFAWVAADSVYGVGDIEGTLWRVGTGYVLGVAASHRFWSWGDKPVVAGTAEEIAQRLEPGDWMRLSAGEGTKGPRLHDWAYCELADLDAAELNESRSGLWTRGLLIRRTVTGDDLAVMRRIDELHLDYPFAGSRMLRDMLRAEGVGIGRQRVATMLKRMGLAAVYRRPNTSKPAPGHKIYPYLLRSLTIERPNQVWAMDITYIPMAQGFVYLCAVLDWFSRRVLAWRVSITMEVDFCLEAVEEAIARHGRPEIFNTDQGSQFTSVAFTGLLLEHGIAISMDGRGSWRDNVFVERLWRSVKYEEVYLRAYEGVREARASIGSYLDFYNRRRPHSSLDARTPDTAYFDHPTPALAA